MKKRVVYHHNLIGHEINESLQYHADDVLDREIYCRKLHIVTEPLSKDCDTCPFLAGFEQGHGIECAWEDVVEEGVLEEEAVISHEERYKEYERVDKLMKQGILKSPSELIELHVKHKSYDEEKWIYEHSKDEQYRYLLGTKGENPLVCMGVNPSMASPESLDATMKRVSSVAERLGYDSYIMLNLYPQRATHAEDLHKQAQLEEVKTNMQYIRSFLQNKNYTIWAAWGDIIEEREYLRTCLEEIIQITDRSACKWITVGNWTKRGNPHHPLYLPKDASVSEFDIHEYS